MGSRLTATDLFRELVLTTGKGRFRALGSSMVPTIWPGDVLEVRRIGGAELQLGQILVYARKGENEREARLFAHRVVQIAGGGGVVSRANAVTTRNGNLVSANHAVHAGSKAAVTRGDAMGVADPPVSVDEIIGVVTTVEHNGKLFVPGMRIGAVVRLLRWASRYTDLPTRLLLRRHRLTPG